MHKRASFVHKYTFSYIIRIKRKRTYAGKEDPEETRDKKPEISGESVASSLTENEFSFTFGRASLVLLSLAHFLLLLLFAVQRCFYAPVHA